MFVTESQTKERGSLQSWYGDPQHEEGDGTDWEIEYYGESGDERTADPVEFVPEVEYGMDVNGDAQVTPSDRPARPLSASD